MPFLGNHPPMPVRSGCDEGESKNIHTQRLTQTGRLQIASIPTKGGRNETLPTRSDSCDIVFGHEPLQMSGFETKRKLLLENRCIHTDLSVCPQESRGKQI